jgi:hypothetical protein
MPVKLREFYLNELIEHKDAERESYENASKKKPTSSGRTNRR